MKLLGVCLKIVEMNNNFHHPINLLLSGNSAVVERVAGSVEDKQSCFNSLCMLKRKKEARSEEDASGPVCQPPVMKSKADLGFICE